MHQNYHLKRKIQVYTSHRINNQQQREYEHLLTFQFSSYTFAVYTYAYVAIVTKPIRKFEI